MIRTEEVFQIGRITRTHGIQGEVEIQYTDDAFDRGDAEYLVLEMDGILVPYFWEEWRTKGAETALFLFDGITTEMQAKRLVGKKVFYPFAHLHEKEDATLTSLKALTGFTVEGIGRIIDVDDSSANTLFTIETPEGEEILIPYHDDFLVSYNMRKRTLTLELPKGLLNLNK